MTLAQRLDDEDAARFVGRRDELAFFDSCLAGEAGVSVVVLHGPGGIGKSTLLREVMRRAARSGWDTRRVDGRALEPVPGELGRALGATGTQKVLVVIDTFERLTALGRSLRETFLPGLPDDSLVVLAQRGQPESDWMQDGWERLTVLRELAPLPRADGLALLRAEGVRDDPLAGRLLHWADGSPLALALAADAVRGGSWSSSRVGDQAQGIAGLLLSRLAESELDPDHLDALLVAAIARTTTRAMLAEVLPDADAGAADAWLRSRTFAEGVRDGVCLHELVREAVRTRARSEFPDRERELRRRVADHLYGRASRGEPRLLVEMAELIAHPALRWGLGSEGTTAYRPDALRARDLELGPARAARVGDEEWWTATEALLRAAPQCAVAARGADDELAGLAIAVTPASAPEAADADPVLGPWLAHAREQMPDGNVLLWRDALDLTDGHGQQDSRVLSVLNTAVILRSALANPRWSFLPIDPTNAAAVAFAKGVGARRVPALDVVLGTKHQQCHILDHGPGGMLGGHRAVVYAELGLAPPGPGTSAAPPTGGSGADAVRDALRNLNRPAELARNPLGRGADPAQRSASVRARLAAGVQEAFGDDHVDQLRRELLVRRYFSGPTTHEGAADVLNVSRATYFRHLRRATEVLSRHVLAGPGVPEDLRDRDASAAGA